MVRKIVLAQHEESYWAVQVDDRWVDSLCWDEALGTVAAALIDPSECRYLRTIEQHERYIAHWDKDEIRRTSVDRLNAAAEALGMDHRFDLDDILIRHGKRQPAHSRLLERDPTLGPPSEVIAAIEAATPTPGDPIVSKRNPIDAYQDAEEARHALSASLIKATSHHGATTFLEIQWDRAGGSPAEHAKRMISDAMLQAANELGEAVKGRAVTILNEKGREAKDHARAHASQFMDATA